MWQAEADTELTLSASPATAVGQSKLYPGESRLEYGNFFVISGRAPALLDSLDQAFLTAPLFVFMEVFFFFGYRPSFYAEIMQEVQQNVEEFRKRKAKTN